MSRSGRIEIKIPESTEVNIQNGFIFAKGKLGSLDYELDKYTNVIITNNVIKVSPKDDSIRSKQMWGTVRSRIFNIILGVSEGFNKDLILNGVGYKAILKGAILELNLGFSHPVDYEIPNDISVKVPKPTEINIFGVDKQKVGQVAANIRAYRKPEPYKGKGIRYKDEVIRRKEGKKK